MISSLVPLVIVATLGQASEDHYFDFRGKPLPETIVLHQDKGHVKIEPEGLRVTLPKDYIHPFGGVGIRTNFGIKGDFDITTTFEILQADVPDTGFGVGVALRVQKAAPSQELANISRMVRSGDRQILYWERSIEGPEKKLRYQAGERANTDKVGRLRLKRTGTTLAFLFAPGTTGDEFEQIQQLEFGDANIRAVSLVGHTGRQPLNLDARFLDLRIVTGTLTAPVAQDPDKEAASDKSRVFWWLVGGVLVLAGALLVIRLLMRRKSRRTIPAK